MSKRATRTGWINHIGSMSANKQVDIVNGLTDSQCDSIRRHIDFYMTDRVHGDVTWNAAKMLSLLDARDHERLHG
jgi:hypothetical protein